MSTPTNNLTISASDIAQLAGVGRSTVSNWRARHEDFPEPVAGSAASPRFDAAAVRAWLTTYGKEVKGLSADRTLWVWWWPSSWSPCPGPGCRGRSPLRSWP